MEIIMLLDELEDEIKSAKRVPLTAKSLIDADYVLEKLDRIRAVLPEEIKTAIKIIDERDRIFEDARRESKYILDDTRFQAAKMISDDEITRNATQLAEEMINKSKAVSQEIREGANQYAMELLTYVEKVLNESLKSVEQGLRELSEWSEKT
ncbi:MAG: ATPase [Syntrophomonadaceae bacterium]|nr:ATPase [Syntrophomonadaceae bacterium]